MSKIETKDLTQFWNFVETLCWNETLDSYTMKQDIMKRYSPLQIEKFLNVCKTLSKNLVDVYKHAGLNVSYFGASNIVGQGKDNYEQYIRPPINILIINESTLNATFNNCFLSVIPCVDDYFVLPDDDSLDMFGV